MKQPPPQHDAASVYSITAEMCKTNEAAHVNDAAALTVMPFMVKIPERNSNTATAYRAKHQ